MATDSSTRKELDPLARGGRRFESKVVVVAGGGQGIGSAVVRRVASEGATVVIGDWVEETARKVAAEVESIGEKASVHQGDYQEFEGCQALMDFAVKEHGRIDSLVVIVGGSIWGAPYHYNTPEQIVATVKKNLWPTMWCTRAVLPYMIEQHKKAEDGVGGNIVTLATHALVGTDRVPYAASKGGLIGLTTSLCKEVGRYGIRINCVAPSSNIGATDRVTPRNYGNENIERSRVPEEERLERPRDTEGNRAERPLSAGLKRDAYTWEIASAIAFLASDDAGYISGEVISCGGGETFPF